MTIERTSHGRNMGPVAQSIVNWYHGERDRLAAERRLFCEERDRRAARGESCADLDRAFIENQAEEERLRKGWESSTVRNANHGRDCPGDGGRESRSVGLSPAGPGLARAEPASKTAVRISGYAAVFDQFSPAWIGFQEQILPGAFAEAIAASDVRLLFNHDANYLFGRSSAATLELREDSHGLRFTGHLLPFSGPEYHLARLIDRGDISGCSFSFSGVTDRWILLPGETDKRIIEKIDTVYDVGPVTYPWYPSTTVAAVFAEAQRAAAPVVAEDFADDAGAFEQWEYDQWHLDYDRRKREERYAYEEMGRILRDVDRHRQ